MNIAPPRRGTLPGVLVVAAAVLVVLWGCRARTTSTDDDTAAADERPTADLVAEMFAGDAPSWPAELVGLELGQPATAWRKQGFDAEGVRPSERFQGVRYRWQLDADNAAVRNVSVEFPAADSPLDLLTRRWGEPATRVDASDERVHLWFNEARQLRAQLRPGFDEGTWRLELGRYLPWPAFVGGHPGRLAFEGDASLIGMRAEAVQARWPDAYHVADGESLSTGSLELPPTRLDTFWTTVDPEFSTGDERIDRYSITLTLDDEAHAALLDALSRVQGEPLEGQLVGSDAAGRGVVHVFLAPDPQRRMRLYFTGEAGEGPREAELTVERYLPLETLLAPASPQRMVFEGERSWLGTMTEAQFNAQRAEAAPDGDRRDGWLRLPPIESDSGEVPLFGVFEDGVMVGYRLSLGFDLVPSFEDQIVATFDRIYGQPSPGEPPTDDSRERTRIYPVEPPIVLEPGPGEHEITVRVGQQPR